MNQTALSASTSSVQVEGAGRPHTCPRVGQEFTFTDSSPTGEFWELDFLFLEFPLGCFPLFLFLS